MWNTELLQIQKYYEKLVMQKGGHRGESEGKRRKLRRCIWLMYSLYENEYRNFQPVEITITRRTNIDRRKIENLNQLGL
jgi:hypothetical protein